MEPLINPACYNVVNIILTPVLLMKQTTFASLAFTEKKRQTRRERFLAEMEDALYEIESMRRFAKLELGEDALPALPLKSVNAHSIIKGARDLS